MDKENKKYVTQLLISKIAILVYITIILELVAQYLYIFEEMDPNIYFNLSFLIIEIAVGIFIAFIVHDRTKQTGKQIENTLKNIKTRADQIDEAVTKIENFEKEQHDFLEKEKSEKKKRKFYAYYEFERDFSHIIRNLKDLEETLNHKSESEKDLALDKDLVQRLSEGTNESISRIRRIADIFRLDVDFNFQMRILNYVKDLEIDLQFIKLGSKRFLPSDTGLLFFGEEIIKLLEEYLKIEKKKAYDKAFTKQPNE